jgi:hypothetical protein
MSFAFPLRTLGLYERLVLEIYVRAEVEEPAERGFDAAPLGRTLKHLLCRQVFADVPAPFVISSNNEGG